jgi:hypothetical protein
MSCYWQPAVVSPTVLNYPDTCGQKLDMDVSFDKQNSARNQKRFIDPGIRLGSLASCVLQSGGFSLP